MSRCIPLVTDAGVFVHLTDAVAPWDMHGHLQAACGTFGHYREMTVARKRVGPTCTTCMKKWEEYMQWERIRYQAVLEDLAERYAAHLANV